MRVRYRQHVQSQVRLRKGDLRLRPLLRLEPGCALFRSRRRWRQLHLDYQWIRILRVRPMCLGGSRMRSNRMRSDVVRHHQRLFGAAVVLAVVALVGAALNPLASSRSQSPSTVVSYAPSDPPPGVQSPTTTAVDPTLAANVGVFRRSRNAFDALPVRLTRDLRFLAPGSGVNASLTRRALVTKTGVAVYAIPANSGACLVSSDLSIGQCAPSSGVLTGRAAGVTVCSPFLPTDQLQLSGFLPDGASNVSMKLSNGSSMAVLVEGNAYVVRMSRSGPLPMTLEWQDQQGGTHAEPTPVPRDAGQTHCAPRRATPHSHPALPRAPSLSTGP